MIQTTLAYEQKRRRGLVPQLALSIQLLNTTLIIVGAGVEGLDDGILTRLDGSRALDGSWQLGVSVHLVSRGLLSISDVTEGDKAGGDPSAPMLTVLPSRATTLRAEIDNTTGALASIAENEPLLGKRAELRLTYPGLRVADMPIRFSGEIAAEELGYERAVLELRGA